MAMFNQFLHAAWKFDIFHDRTLGLKYDNQVWPWAWPWPWIFKVKLGICSISAKNGPIAKKRKANILIKLKSSNVTIGFDLGMTLTLNFQGQIWNLWYLSQEWSDCYETKSKLIDWTQGLKCDHQVLPWLWPWPWIFKVKYGICYISTKSGPKVRCKDLPDSDWGDFKCRFAVDSSSYQYSHQLIFQFNGICNHW